MALSEEQRRWPVCRVDELVLAQTGVTAAALPLLQLLGSLCFLDVRRARRSRNTPVGAARTMLAPGCLAMRLPRSCRNLPLAVTHSHLHHHFRVSAHTSWSLLKLPCVASSRGLYSYTSEKRPTHGWHHRYFLMSSSICIGVVLEP